MTLPVKWVTREEMLGTYVARFNDLRGSDKGCWIATSPATTR